MVIVGKTYAFKNLRFHLVFQDRALPLAEPILENIDRRSANFGPRSQRKRKGTIPPQEPLLTIIHNITKGQLCERIQRPLTTRSPRDTRLFQESRWSFLRPDTGGNSTKRLIRKKTFLYPSTLTLRNACNSYSKYSILLTR